MNAKLIFDCHVNIHNDSQYKNLYFAQQGRVRTGQIQAKTDADSIYTNMEKVEKAIIFSPKYLTSIGIDGSDSVVAAAVQKFPDKFVGFAYVDPREADYMEQLRHSICNLRLKGLKYGPIYNGVPLDDPRLLEVFAFCEKEDVPVTLHMGTTFAKNAPLELGRAIHVEPIAMRFPDLKICLAHLGHPWTGECIAVVRKQPNVYTEISALFYRPWQFYNSLIACQEYKIVDKVFFGTDYPYTTVDESIDGLKNVNQFVGGTKLPIVSEETISSIMHSNPFEHWWHDSPL